MYRLVHEDLAEELRRQAPPSMREAVTLALLAWMDKPWRLTSQGGRDWGVPTPTSVTTSLPTPRRAGCWPRCWRTPRSWRLPTPRALNVPVSGPVLWPVRPVRKGRFNRLLRPVCLSRLAVPGGLFRCFSKEC